MDHDGTDGVTATRSPVSPAAVAVFLRGRLEALVQAAVDAIFTQVPAYAAHATPDLRAESAEHCRAVFSAFIATLEQGRAPERGDFTLTTHHAMRRVDMGVELADFVRAFRVGQAAIWEQVSAGVDELPGGKDTLLGLVSHLMETIEVGSSAAAEAYVEAANLSGADRERIQRDLLEDLLAGRVPVIEARRSALERAGLNLDGTLLVGVGRTTVAPEGFATLPDAAHFASTALARDVGGLVIVRQQEVIGVLPVPAGAERRVVSRIARLVEALAGRGIPMTVGISTLRTGVTDVPAAYREADMARASLREETGVRALSALSPLDYLVLRSDDSARHLIGPAVRTFVEEDRQDGWVLVETLRSYVRSDMNAKAVATDLHLHVNTVYYRLDRIGEKTGYDLRKVPEVIDLFLAVRLLTDA